jgi:nucleoside phosphorylase
MDISNWENRESRKVEIFCCYARKDQSLLLELTTHLAPLQREGLITLWADIDINAGAEWEKEIHRHLNTASIILLLVSPDFIASDYCYSTEMRRAMERHECGEVCVIPVILRPVIWEATPFGKLQALPQNAEPVTSNVWHRQDEAFLDVAKGVRDVVLHLKDLSSSLPQKTFSLYKLGGQTAKFLKERSTLEVDFGIVTSKPLERDAVIRCLDKCEKVQNEHLDIRTYYLGDVAVVSGLYKVVVVLTSDAGTVDAVATTGDLIRHWNPRYVIMLGIAGGISRDGLTLGDVVVADQVIEYEYAKELPEHTELRPRVHRCDALLLSRVKDLSNWSHSIDVPRPLGPLRTVPKLFVGPIASGNKVVANGQGREKFRSLHPHMLAVEMEGEGVATAAWQLSQPKGVLVVRGISDLADSNKSDEWQPYAAATAATFFVDFLRSEPVTMIKNRDHMHVFDIGLDSDSLERFYK